MGKTREKEGIVPYCLTDQGRLPAKPGVAVLLPGGRPVSRLGLRVMAPELSGNCRQAERNGRCLLEGEFSRILMKGVNYGTAMRVVVTRTHLSSEIDRDKKVLLESCVRLEQMP